MYTSYRHSSSTVSALKPPGKQCHQPFYHKSSTYDDTFWPVEPMINTCSRNQADSKSRRKAHWRPRDSPRMRGLLCGVAELLVLPTCDPSSPKQQRTWSAAPLHAHTGHMQAQNFPTACRPEPVRARRALGDPTSAARPNAAHDCGHTTSAFSLSAPAATHERAPANAGPVVAT